MKRFSFFHAALVLSLLLHISLLGYFSRDKVEKLRKPLKKIEITYQKIKEKKTIQPEPKFKDTKVLKNKEQKKQREITPVKETKDKFIDFQEEIKDISRLSGKMPLEKKLSPKITPKEMQRSISVPMLHSEKITNPQYLSYNQTIRQRIRQRAYQYVDHPDFATGEVYLSFIIDQQGRLRDVHILSAQTTANQYLQDIGLRSVREAAPFKPFPEDLVYPELTFNVAISFTIDE